ncbi:MAG TPA: hypothetical protein DEA78_24150 [Cyanobacteria bacterium UBA11159]|nr:hypothetical protein [Cyanobacteria bacterium UBA11367]HBE58929.1 hypothetical protein [Cyanobacteria bacterium UBA11366]HBK65816.1 hypothetical protein [Cyanobacteria bacterium UBA11166]HBR76687.1 hypothetical protein [Cyanobacteria bacterium UBA11159]
MKSPILFVAISVIIFSIACSTSIPVEEATSTPLKSGEKLPNPPSISPSPLNSGQMLPISAEVQIAGERILLEVTRTPQQQQMGLMYRTSLAPDRGMLFSFNPAQMVSFWMKNVKISLDMIFLHDGEVKAIASDVPGCTANPCPTYSPQVPIDQVIELRGGRAAELGLKVGDRLHVKFLD